MSRLKPETIAAKVKPKLTQQKLVSLKERVERFILWRSEAKAKNEAQAEESKKDLSNNSNLISYSYHDACATCDERELERLRIILQDLNEILSL